MLLMVAEIGGLRAQATLSQVTAHIIKNPLYNPNAYALLDSTQQAAADTNCYFQATYKFADITQVDRVIIKAGNASDSAAVFNLSVSVVQLNNKWYQVLNGTQYEIYNASGFVNVLIARTDIPDAETLIIYTIDKQNAESNKMAFKIESTY